MVYCTLCFCFLLGVFSSLTNGILHSSFTDSSPSVHVNYWLQRFKQPLMKEKQWRLQLQPFSTGESGVLLPKQGSFSSGVHLLGALVIGSGVSPWYPLPSSLLSLPLPSLSILSLPQPFPTPLPISLQYPSSLYNITDSLSLRHH